MKDKIKRVKTSVYVDRDLWPITVRIARSRKMTWSKWVVTLLEEQAEKQTLADAKEKARLIREQAERMADFPTNREWKC